MIWDTFVEIWHVMEELKEEGLWEVGSKVKYREKSLFCQEQNFILRDKRIVPGQLRGEILDCVHETLSRGLWGKEKTPQRLSTLGWPKMTEDMAHG